MACDFEQLVRPIPAEPQGTQVLDGAVEVDGFPVDDRGGDEAQAGCPEALILEDPVTDFALHRMLEDLAKETRSSSGSSTACPAR